MFYFALRTSPVSKKIIPTIYSSKAFIKFTNLANKLNFIDFMTSESNIDDEHDDMIWHTSIIIIQSS